MGTHPIFESDFDCLTDILQVGGQDAGQRGHSPRSATSDLRWQAAGGWPHVVGLQHPEGFHPPLGAPPPWWRHRALASCPGAEVQLRQDDLPQVLRPSSPTCDQLSQEEVRPHFLHPPQEEAQVICAHCYYHFNVNKLTSHLTCLFKK